MSEAENKASYHERTEGHITIEHVSRTLNLSSRSPDGNGVGIRIRNPWVPYPILLIWGIQTGNRTQKRIKEEESQDALSSQ